jgi:carbohydrate esterase-like sialic acid-specific acetylesterase
MRRPLRSRTLTWTRHAAVIVRPVVVLATLWLAACSEPTSAPMPAATTTAGLPASNTPTPAVDPVAFAELYFRYIYDAGGIRYFHADNGPTAESRMFTMPTAGRVAALYVTCGPVALGSGNSVTFTIHKHSADTESDIPLACLISGASRDCTDTNPLHATDFVGGDALVGKAVPQAGSPFPLGACLVTVRLTAYGDSSLPHEPVIVIGSAGVRSPHDGQFCGPGVKDSAGMSCTEPVAADAAFIAPRAGRVAGIAAHLTSDVRSGWERYTVHNLTSGLDSDVSCQIPVGSHDCTRATCKSNCRFSGGDLLVVRFNRAGPPEGNQRRATVEVADAGSWTSVSGTFSALRMYRVPYAQNFLPFGYRASTAATLRNLRVRLSAPPSDYSTITLETGHGRDAVATALRCTTQVTETRCEDTTHAVPVSAGDTVHLLATSQGVTDPGKTIQAVFEWDVPPTATPTEMYGRRRLTIQSPLAYETWQRDSSGHADLQVVGAYVGAPTGIEASWNGGPWILLDGAPIGGRYSGKLPGQSAGQGTLAVRFLNEPAVSASVPYVGIGDVFVIAGQSNATGHGTHDQVYAHPTLKAALFGNDDHWKELHDPTDDDADQVDAISVDVKAAGSAWPLLATYILADQNVPVAFVPCPRGGTAIGTWARNTAPTWLYGSCMRRIHLLHGIKAWLWWQGEADAFIGTSQADYKARLDQLGANVFSDFGVKVVAGSIGYKSDATASHVDAIRLAQQAAWDDGTNILSGPVLYDIELPAGEVDHFVSDSNLARAAARWWAALRQHFYGGANGRGPILSSLIVSRDRTALIATFSTLSPPLMRELGAASWLVKAGGNLVPVSSVTRTADNQITIKLSAAGTGPLTLSYASGNTAAGQDAVRDAQGLPADVFIDVPATPAQRLETRRRPTSAG